MAKTKKPPPKPKGGKKGMANYRKDPGYGVGTGEHPFGYDTAAPCY